MTASRPDNEALFHAARAIPDPDRRREYVRQACGGDEARIAQVEALLAAADAPDSLLDRPGAGTPGATIDQPATERPGTVIGPYKLIEPIGEGGMGTVWMAQQTQPVKRLVAIKLIKAGMDSAQVIARFEAERQALALMDHPNIARVLDGGTVGKDEGGRMKDEKEAASSSGSSFIPHPSSFGRPYFVMDLVKGVPITRYCDAHHLTPRQRLELFIPVCQAIQHAHHKGIIHRDLKPSNVLVAPYDGKPVPKVIDFGVAKAAGQQLTDRTLVTGFGAVVGTLEYMSPEQAELNNHDIDTRSDIYALGVLLYELLAGSPPFSRKELEKAGMVEMLRVIREQEPSKPSRKLSTAAGLPTLAANRGTEPAKLTRLVRGELDWIVMKALEKDRTRRYETANGFAMDVQRYLADEPVVACPPSAGYRLRKFARRNRGRLAVAAVLGVALLAVVGVTAGSIGWMARDREARLARLTGQVETILEEAARLSREQKWSEARTALERAEAVTADEADDALRQRIADARRDLAFVAELDRIRQERAATVEGKFNDAGAAEHYAEAFRAYGLDVDALSAEEVAARLQGKPALAVAVAAALDDWVDARRFGAEEMSWKPLVAVARRLDPDPLRDRLRAVWGQRITRELQTDLLRLAGSIDVKAQRPATLQALARTLNRVGLAGAALRILLDGRRAYPGDFWLNYALGNQLFLRRDYAGMLLYCSAAVSLRPDSSFAHNSLGIALDQQRKPDEAVAEYRLAIELDPKNGVAHSNLGNALGNQGKLDEAIACHQKAIKINPKYASAHHNLGVVLHRLHKLDDASACFRKAIEIYPSYALAHYGLGAVLLDQRKLDDAIACFETVINLNRYDAAAHYSLGNALRDQGKLDDAIAEYRKAIAIDPRYSYAHHNLGVVLFRQKKLDEAIAEYRKAIAFDPNNAFAHYNLGVALSQQNKLDEAITEYRTAVAIDPKYLNAHYHLGNALRNQGKLDEAIAEYRKASALGPQHLGVHYNLANACARLGRWEEALATMDKVAELAPADPWHPYKAAALHLRAGDLAGYRNICREMLERFGDTEDPGVAELVAMTCLLLPEAVADRDRVLKLADWPMTRDVNNRWFLFCRALAEHRAGRHTEAVQGLERYAPRASGGAGDASAFAVLALAQHQQGRREDALAALDQAERIVAAKLPDPAGGRPFGDDWYDWLHSQALLGEAEKLLKPAEARVHFYAGSRLGGQGKWPEAEVEYREAVRLRPTWYEPHYQLALAIWEQGRPKDAQAAFREALRLKPKGPRTPARSTFVTPWSDSDHWVVRGQEVHQLDEGPRTHVLLFGDPNWEDYDFEAEINAADGRELGLVVRATRPNNYVKAVFDASGNWHGMVAVPEGSNVHLILAGGHRPLTKGHWHRLCVEARGNRFKMFLDGKLLLTVDAGERLRGCVGLLTNPAHARFRNLIVTDATGTVLLEGVQDVLPRAKAASPPQ
jgi:tetratricopeptide (TPR) repeat protein